MIKIRDPPLPTSRVEPVGKTSSTLSGGASTLARLKFDTVPPAVGKKMAEAGAGSMDRNVLDAQVRASVNQKLEESGEKERLKELLRKKLIERGWRDELKEYCKEVIKSKGLEQISVEDLVSEITPRGRATIPDDIKAELLERIRKFLSTN
jgi:enhancer of yellow 2 transcription factor